jgi:type I restriction enzyme, R subunit
LQNESVSAVIGAMESHNNLSTQILNNPDIFQKMLAELVPIIYNEMKKWASPLTVETSP